MALPTDFLIIAITFPGHIEREAERIMQLLAGGEADYVHIRKPGWTPEETERLIASIAPRMRSRLKLHDHFELASRYALGGVHLNSRNRMAPEDAVKISKSCHSVEELADAGRYEYVTLSPVFDSISKQGYRSAFDLDSLRPWLEGKRVVALGGVTPERIPLLRDAGFSGAAMLGYFWNQ